MSAPQLPRHLRQLFDDLDLHVAGFRYNKHFVVRLTHRRGELPAQSFSSSASDRRALKNARAQLRRAIDQL